MNTSPLFFFYFTAIFLASFFRFSFQIIVLLLSFSLSSVVFFYSPFPMSSAIFPSAVQNLAVALNTKYRHGMLGEENKLPHVTAKSHISPTRLSRRRVGASALSTHLLTHRQPMIITAQNRRWIVIAILVSIFPAFLSFPLLFFLLSSYYFSNVYFLSWKPRW